MKNNIRQTLGDNTIRRATMLYIVFLLMFAGMLVWKWTSLPLQVPLFYSVPRGEERLGTPSTVLLLPLLSLVFFTVNFLTALWWYPQEKLAGILLILSATLMSFLLLFTALRIIMRVT